MVVFPTIRARVQGQSSNPDPNISEIRSQTSTMAPKPSEKPTTVKSKSKATSRPAEEPKSITGPALFQPPTKKQPKRKATLGINEPTNAAQSIEALDSAFKPTLKVTADPDSSPSPSVKRKISSSNVPSDAGSPWEIEDYNSERGDASDTETKAGVRRGSFTEDLTKSAEDIRKSRDLSKSVEDLPDEDLTAKSFLTAPKRKRVSKRTAKAKEDLGEDFDTGDEEALDIRVSKSPKREKGGLEEDEILEKKDAKGVEKKR